VGQASRLPSAGRARGHAASVTAPSKRTRLSVALTSAAARLWRAGRLRPSEAAPPTCIGSRRFRTSGRVFLPPLGRDGGRDGRTAYPSSLQSEKRTQRPKLVAIAKPPLRCGFAGRGSVLRRPRSAWRLRRPWRSGSGPLLRPAIRGHLARASAHQLTTSRGPRDEPLRNSATPTGGSEGAVGALVGQASRLPGGWADRASSIQHPASGRWPGTS